MGHHVALDNLARYQYFPITYDQGRAWFAAAVQSIGGQHIRYDKPDIVGPSGETLSIDLGWVGPADATKIFLCIAGTHGQEYFAGAAAQLKWILEKGPQSLPRDTAICFIHGLNPFGAAHSSRSNENFVDLNRNYRDMSVPLRPVKLFKALSDILSVKEMDEHIFYDVLEAFDDFMERHDKNEVMTAIAGGQDAFPSSIAFAGTSEQWEITTLRKIIRDQLNKAEKVALIDWHTGLGPFGEASVLLDLPTDSQGYNLGSQWWGEPQSAEEIYDSAAEPDYVGHICHGAAEDLRTNGAEVVETVIEFGTVSNKAIIPAFLIDRWLRFECKDPLSPHAIKMQTIMMERYNPSTPEWREAVLATAQDLYERTLQGLDDWS